MARLIIGFVLGVVVTVVVTQWLGRADNSAVQAPGDVSTAPDLSESSPSQQGERRSAPVGSPVASNETAAPGDPEADVDFDDRVPSTAVPQATHDATSATPVQQSGTGAQTASSSGERTVGRSEYPPEIAEMIENRVDKELQARYENDQREDSWAPYMEGLLTAYFAQKPELAQFYFSLVDCRTSVCSVHAMGYGPDALTQWTVATADLVEQPWFEFNSMSMNRRNPVPDVLAVVLIITRNPAD